MMDKEYKAYRKAVSIVLLHYMKKSDLSVEELADQSGVGEETVARAMNPEDSPPTSFVVVMKICKVLGESLDSVGKHVERIKNDILADEGR